ncbi:MAG: hypothetical protein R2942_13385 [Ignavibacteria bacterium]
MKAHSELSFLCDCPDLSKRSKSWKRYTYSFKSIRNPGVPTPSDSVTVTVTATDPGDSPVTIQNMSVLYRFNGGAFISKNMDLVAGNIYSTKMPQHHLVQMLNI